MLSSQTTTEIGAVRNQKKRILFKCSGEEKNVCAQSVEDKSNK